MFSAQRVRVTRKGKPGEGAWAVYRRNLDGSEPRYYLSNAPEDTMLETLAYRHRVQQPRSSLAGVRQDTCRKDGLAPVGDRPAVHRHLYGGGMMSMNGEPVPPEGLDYIKNLEQWLEQYPNDVIVRSKMADLQRDPRFAEPDEPDDIMPQVPELAEFPVPPGLKKYIDATRIVAGASIPTSAACIAAAFNLLAAEDIDVQSRANAPHPSGLYFVVGSESGWRKSASFRETMQGHVEADERVEALHHEADSNTEEGMESRAKGFSPRALRQDFTIEAGIDLPTVFRFDLWRRFPRFRGQ